MSDPAKSISSTQIKALSDACLELYEAGLTPETFKFRSFRFLQHLVAAEFYVYGSIHSKTHNITLAFNEDRDEFSEAMPSFIKLMHQYPLYCWDPFINDGKPFCRSDFFSSRQFRDTDMYSEVYNPLGVDNHCAVYVPSEDDEVIFLGIERLGPVDFSQEERFLLELAQPHLENAYRVAWANSKCDLDNLKPDTFTPIGMTGRESEVLYWVAQGKSNPEIATLLNIRLQTVKGYIASIFDKIGVDNRCAAMIWAFEQAKMGIARREENISIYTGKVTK